MKIIIKYSKKNYQTVRETEGIEAIQQFTYMDFVIQIQKSVKNKFKTKHNHQE